ncbi:MAG: sensor histidine kinase, partial [Chloroflexi bacterium]|nr:sensor histidine kinase [Chloroflexota bacterium]
SVSVQDTGPGIAPNDLAHIFERFYRADHARSRHNGGAGLGLSIVRLIAEAHGGRVTVESAVGSGSTFTIVLPLANHL